MDQIDIKGIEPENHVTIEYNDSLMGSYEMDLEKNRFIHVFGALHGIKSLNTPGHQLTKTDLKEFLEDHVKEANLRLSRGNPTGIKSIKVDNHLVFEPKMIAYEKAKEKEGTIMSQDKNTINPVKNEKVIALDTETTGFLADDEVLQLSVLDGNGKTLFNEYFKPNHKTSWESAMQCNHITPEMVSDKKPITAYKEQIEGLLKQADRIVGYNTGFDMTMLSQNGIDLPNEKKYVDLMVPFADVMGKKDMYGKPKMQKLVVCAAHYGFKQDDDWHNSMADTNATMFCYHKMVEKGHLADKDVKELSGLKNFKSREEQLKALENSKTHSEENSKGR